MREYLDVINNFLHRVIKKTYEKFIVGLNKFITRLANYDETNFTV